METYLIFGAFLCAGIIAAVVTRAVVNLIDAKALYYQACAFAEVAGRDRAPPAGSSSVGEKLVAKTGGL